MSDPEAFDALECGVIITDDNRRIHVLHGCQVRKSLEEKISWMESHDHITGLPNYETFRQHIEKNIGENQNLSIIKINLTGLSAINASLGWHTGNRVLKKTGESIRKNIPQDCILARGWGSTFLATAPYPVEIAACIASEIHETLKHPIEIDGMKIMIESRAGLAAFPEHASQTEDLLACASAALDHAKRHHLAIWIYNTQENDILRHHEIKHELVQLLGEPRPPQTPSPFDTGEMCLHFQPQFHIRSSNPHCMEALLRWTSPKLGIVSPGEFIPVAEKSGIIRNLTHNVVRQAVRTMKQWKMDGMPLKKLAINLSAADLIDVSTVERILDCIDREHGKPEWLEFEITETMALRQPEAAIDIICALSSHGCTFSIDDFGAGYSSLNYLKILPAHWVKLDRALIRDMHRHERDQALVKACVSMAHGVGMKAMAEGVEDHSQLNSLRAWGCDAVQGWLIARPMPASEVPAWLARRQPAS